MFTKFMDNAIKPPEMLIWDFDKAPIEYQKLSKNNGKEDLVILTTRKYLKKRYFPFIEESQNVQWIDFEGKLLIIIGNE